MVTHVLPSAPVPDLQDSELRLSTKLIGSSDNRGWRGVGVYHHQAKTQAAFVTPPETMTMHMPMLALHTKGIVNLRCRTPRRLYETVSHPGGLCVMPTDFDGAWSWRGSAELMHIYLTPELIAIIAEEVGRTDPDHIAVGEHFDAHDAFVYELGQAFLSELYTPGYGGRLYAESIAAALTLHVLRNYADFAVVHTPSRRGLPPPLLRRVLDYIHDQLDHDLALADLAAVAGLSPSYFLRQFKAATGLAPHQYVLEQRVLRAKQLLLASQYTVAEVARLAGFNDQSHLHRHFKRAFGVAPRDVLHMSKNRHVEGEIVQDSVPDHMVG